MGKKSNITHQCLKELNKQKKFGESKHEAKQAARKAGKNSATVKGIYSTVTFNSYVRVCKQFISETIASHKEVKTFADCKKYVSEFLKGREEKGVSAWTLAQYGSALASAYNCTKNDFDYDYPVRHRADIKRCRGVTSSDYRHPEERWDTAKMVLNKLSDLTRDILEEYFIWVRTSSGYNSHKANVSILNLKVFLDWGQLLEKKDMPDQPLIMRNDYVLKTKKESRYLTDSEVKGLLNVLPQMPKLYGRMVYCLLFLGMRFSELAKLDVNAIKKNDDGTYYLDLWQYKTQAVNEKSVFENTLKIMAAEIERNKKRFGEGNVKYVFVTDQNTPVANGTLNDNINKVLTKNNVLGRDGKILHVTTHRFRATVATNLISEGVSVDVAAQLLGQTTLSSLSHYATVANDVVKEQLKPRLEKDEMLIRNIGKGKDMAEIIPEKSVALCNGYCGKNPLTTPCAKANACFNCSMFIPSIQFLNAYHIQLLEIEATIKVAEANNYDMMLKKALKEKVALEKIIEKLEKGDRKNDS